MHKHMLRAAVLIALAVALFRTATLAAAPSAAPSPAPSSPLDPNGDMNVKITSQTLKYEDAKHLLILDGNVVVTHKDTVITSPHAEFLTDKQLGHFSGGVKITQPGTTITSKRLDAYYTERKAVLIGSVQMVT